MVKRSSEEPADKAAERLRQWEDAREPVPAEEKKKEVQPGECTEPEEREGEESTPDQTNKNK